MSSNQGPVLTGTEIAIVGMAGRFPGARTIPQFWRNLRDGVESIRPLSDEELLAAGVPADKLRDPNYVKAAAVLDDVEWWDNGFFGFSPKDAAIMDPQHRLFLEVAWEAMEDAGHPPAKFGGPVGVWAGCGVGSYFTYHLVPNRELMEGTGFFLVRHTGNDKDFLSTRVSYEFDLRGPSVNVQTACSTSLVAVHMASQSLLSGECDMALAGGVTIELPQQHGYEYKEGEILSPDGHCRAFDADSKGTVFGSGAGVVVLRRLEDALRDGDHVYAVVRGSAINNDGSSKVGYLAPSVDGQAGAISEALAIAGVGPESITYVETHGTGTPIGDPIEVAALTQAYRAAGATANQYCGIGSLKTNIGHLDTAAGVASLIKATLGLVHREIPANLGWRAPNPAIDFATSPFYVNAERRPWAPGTDGVRRAGVSSLGVGGTNAHIIVEEAPAPAPTTPDPRAAQLLVLSAKTKDALESASTNLAEHLREHPDADLADVAWTLQVGRTAMGERRTVVAASVDEAIARLEAFDDKGNPPQQAQDGATAAFCFAGGGAQYAGMGAGLYRAEPVYRAAVDECLAIMRGLLPGVDLAALLFAAGDARAAAQAELERPSRALPALFTTQYAVARLLESWGVKPDAMIGHSMGEYTAACLAGVFSLEHALGIVTRRGILFETVPKGGMLSVPMSAEALQPLLGADLSMAAVNGPELCVASGPVDALARLEQQLAAMDVEAKRVHIDIAAHSHMLEGILGEFEAFLRTVPMHAPQLPFVSNLTGTWITAAEATDPTYWVRHLRQTVRFAEGVGTLFDGTARVLIEVGPGRTLTTLAKMHPKGASAAAFTSMRHVDAVDADEQAIALGLLGRLWGAGVDVDWSLLHGESVRRRVSLPTYPFQRQRHWFDRMDPAAMAAAGAHAPAGNADDHVRRPVGEWYAQLAWTRTPLPDTAETVAPGTRTLVFHDERGVADALAERLAASGREVLHVRAGERFERIGDAAFLANPASPDDVEHVIKALAAAGRLPQEIVHCWAMGAADDRPALARVADAEGRAYHSLHALARALGREDAGRTALLVVTAGAQAVSGEPSLDPLQALVLGPATVIPRELPTLKVRAVDVQVGAAGGWKADRLTAQLARELATVGKGDDVVALRGADRWARSIAPVALPDADASRKVRDGGVYLVTGGLQGIGLVLAERLARSAKGVKLALVARTALPPRERWDATTDARAAQGIRAVRALEALGAEVMPVSADVTDAAQMAAAVRDVKARWGAVHGVVHAAGVIADAPLEMKTAAEAARVLAPKVTGTLVLDAVLREQPLDFMVLCSSISSMAGLPGQVDYAAANAFLDAYARERQERDGTRVVAIGWSAWREVGMVAGGSSMAPADTGHPLLGRRVNGAEDEVLYAVELGVHTSWALAEHRVRGGRSLIPGTGYLEIARAAMAQRAGERGALELRDVTFLSPFSVPDEGTRELRVHVSGPATPGARCTLLIAGRGEGESAGAWEEHVMAKATWIDAGAAPTHDVAALRARAAGRVETRDAAWEDPHLAFGPRWKNVTEIAYGNGEAVASLTLPAGYEAELATFALHPALMDMATACAQALVPGFDAARDFFVPLSYTRLVMRAPLTPTLVSHVRLRTDGGYDPNEIAAFDVTITDAEGRELVAIEEFLMTRIADGAQIAGDPSQRRRQPRRTSVDLDAEGQAVATGEPAWLAEAIRPAEGSEAFARILASATTAHVFATPRPVPAMVRDLLAPASPAAAPKKEPAAPKLPLHEVEAVLAAHEAVNECVVLAKVMRNGQVKLAAFVVYDPAQHVTVSELRRYLKKALPEHLVPAAFVGLDALPRGGDGAVDRAALPDPFGGEDQFVGPRTEMERVIAETWCEVLGIDKVSVHDNFFDVGGHSLLAVRVVTKLDKKVGVRLNQAVMVLQTLEQIAAECERRAGTAAPAATAQPAAGAPGVPASVAELPSPKGAEPAAPAEGGIARKLFGSFLKSK